MGLLGKFVVGGVAIATIGHFVGTASAPALSNQGAQGTTQASASPTPAASDDDDTPKPQDTSAASEETDAEKIADGTHCVGGWDNSMYRVKDAVKAQLRDPDSFEHIETVWTRMGKDGKFLLSMKYRAHNGFGGMNVEEADAVVDATTCHFKFVPGSVLMKRLKNYPV